MNWLVLAIFVAFIFGQFFKWSQSRGHLPSVVVSSNYLVLGGLLTVYSLVTSTIHLSSAVLMIGAATGVCLISTMLALTRGLEVNHSAPILTSFRLSILIPVVASTMFWQETLSRTQGVGIGLALTSLMLMTQRVGKEKIGHSSHQGVGLICLVFFLHGAGMVCMRWIHHAGLDDQRQQVLLVASLIAGTGGAIFSWVVRCPLRKTDLIMGSSLGLFNLFGLTVMLTAISKLDASVFFPIQGCATVILDNLFSHLYWRERLTSQTAVGAALGAASMFLII